MKYFTSPEGKFIIKIPVEWQYTNIIAGYDHDSPFSFQLYKDPIGAFQISCYSEKEQVINPNVPKQKMDTNKLRFIQSKMDDPEFKMLLWYAVVEDHMFMAKYVFKTNRESDPLVIEEIQKVELALCTLQLLSPSNRELAIELDKYEKFMASLAATFDLRARAFESGCFIEFLLIIANQIDAYLRMAIVLKKQLDLNTNRIEISLLFQEEDDIPITERNIYSQALSHSIIDQATYDSLNTLYTERNKIVHRYIISDFTTEKILQVAHRYEGVCETVRNALAMVEELQAQRQIGIHAAGVRRAEDYTFEDRQFIYSHINDKHSLRGLNRPINE